MSKKEYKCELLCGLYMPLDKVINSPYIGIAVPFREGTESCDDANEAA